MDPRGNYKTTGSGQGGTERDGLWLSESLRCPPSISPRRRHPYPGSTVCTGTVFDLYVFLSRSSSARWREEAGGVCICRERARTRSRASLSVPVPVSSSAAPRQQLGAHRGHAMARRVAGDLWGFSGRGDAIGHRCGVVELKVSLCNSPLIRRSVVSVLSPESERTQSAGGCQRQRADCTPEISTQSPRKLAMHTTRSWQPSIKRRNNIQRMVGRVAHRNR
jgi:hypothetical protein